MNGILQTSIVVFIFKTSEYYAQYKRTTLKKILKIKWVVENYGRFQWFMSKYTKKMLWKKMMKIWILGNVYGKNWLDF